MPDTGAAPTADRLQDSDGFAGRALGLQWSWNHNPENGAWSLAQRPGWLRLTALPAEHLVTARNTLTQVLQGPRTRITARLDISRMTEGQRAGLTLFGVRPSWIGVVRSGGANHVALAVEGDETVGPRLAGAMLVLAAEVSEGQVVRFSYSIDEGRSFRSLGEPAWLARFSWWKGSRPGLFTFTRGTAPTPGSIDVDWFRVDRAAF